MTKRLLELEPTGLFGDEAILTSLQGREELSRPFDFELTIASPKNVIKPEDVIGQPLAVRINRDEEEPRYIHGYISQFRAGNSVETTSGMKMYRMYQVRIVPWLWFMSRASRCFVYLPEKAEKSIQDVLDEVMKRVKSYGHVIPEIESGNAKVLSKRKVEHCVQYRETDLNFLSRTLERFGVYYYFKYTKGKHTVVLSDQVNYPNAPEAEVRYPDSKDDRSGEDVITSWEHSYEFVTGKWEHTDYDFIHPSTDLKSNAQKHGAISLRNNGAYERYEYPGDYSKKDEGEADAEIRLEAEEIQFNTVHGTSYCKTFSPGYCFKLTEHPTCKDEKGKTYLLTSVSHSATQPGPFNNSVEGATYENSFTCVPKELQFRPVRLSPQPLLSSVQTAMVVGPSGEEIYTDEYGRVKVQFHWDREGKKDENTSCWVRVCQVHAGKGFGGIDIPRVGEEVVVSFLEGDLDRPLITGRVYHKESMPPFGLPAAKTVSGMKTQTYKGKGHNEMSMNDTPGKEKINIHAQYDMATTVQNNHSVKIVSGKHTFDVDVGTAAYTVKGAVTETFKATQNTTVQESIDIKTNASHIRIDSPTEIKLTVKGSTVTITPDTIKLESDNIAIIGRTKIDISSPTIKIVGNSEISASAPKVQISGKNEAAIGVGNQSVKCDTAQVAVAGAAIKSSATGQHDISGALVKIN
jgi:type VI secretion system secreted protein VgrG